MKKILSILTILVITQITIYSQPSSPVLLPVKDDPAVTFRIMFNAGSQFDPAGKEGLAQLTAAMISEGGTKNNTYEQVLEKLYPLAAGYDVAIGVETATFNGRVHKDNLEKYYSLMMDALLSPAFNETDFTRLKENVLNYLNTTLKYSNDEELGKTILYNRIFEGTPYGHITSGTITGLNNITLQDVKDFYTRYYNRNNFVLGIGGGYDEALVQKIQQDLLKLPDNEKQTVPAPKPNVLKGLKVTIIEKEAPATAISIGFPINVTRGNKDWYALAIANSWLGEHRNSSSHLYQVIRESRGLNYGDYSYIENFPFGGNLQMPPVNYPRRQQLFEIWIRPVPNETRHFALRAALRELKMLVDNGLTKEQFELTRNFLSKYILHYAPTTSTRLGYALDDVFYGINGSHLDMFRKMMSQVTLEDVNAAIKKYLQYDNMEIAIITKDGEKLKKDIASNTESPIQYASAKPENIVNEDKAIIQYPLNISEENIDVLGVDKLFK